MAEKAKVSHQVAEAYQELLDKHEGNSLAVVYEWSEKILPHKTDSVLKDIDWFTLLALMTGGYEVFEFRPEDYWMDKKYRYFVSYFYTSGFANAEIRRATPIISIGDIVEVSKDIEQNNSFADGSVVIIAYQLFE